VRTLRRIELAEGASDDFSEWPKPYCAAVSIQLTPSSTAWWIAATESSSSWVPQPQS
jgi:hypothetical protein